MKIVAIAGVGLIGGSFGLALRHTGFDGEVIGVSSPRTIAAAVAKGAITRGVSLEEAAETADLLYLSQPVDSILETLRRLGPLYRPGCLVTDAGSTKAAIVHQASQYLPAGAFLGGHPLAGKESRGVETADPNLFAHRPYVLTTSADSPAYHETAFRSLLSQMQAQVLDMAAPVHDATVAFTSHLPQLLSTALAATLAKSDNPYLDRVFGTGLLDMTRLALSAPDLWRSILTTNRTEVMAALNRFTAELDHVREHLQSGEVDESFHTGGAFASQLRKIAR